MSDSINNPVCKACGATRNQWESIGALYHDEICTACRSYEQQLIEERIRRMGNGDIAKRRSYFAHLEVGNE